MYIKNQDCPPLATAISKKSDAKPSSTFTTATFSTALYCLALVFCFELFASFLPFSTLTVAEQDIFRKIFNRSSKYFFSTLSTIFARERCTCYMLPFNLIRKTRRSTSYLLFSLSLGTSSSAYLKFREAILTTHFLSPIALRSSNLTPCIH